MSELPEGWVQQPLNNIASLKTGPFGSALKKSDYQSGATPVVNPMHITEGKIYPSHDMTVSQQTLERLAEFRLAEGDVVMGRRGEMGRCAVINEEQTGWLCGSGSFIVRPTEAVNPRYLQRFLSSPSVIIALIESSVGSTMVNLNQQIMRSLVVPLPPLAEQKRIADKLDALLARVDGCRARLARVPVILKRFRQAVLAAATSGALTADWRGSSNYNEYIHSGVIPAEWQALQIQDIAEVKGGKRLPNGEKLLTENTGYPYIRAGQLKNGTVIADEQMYLSEEVQKTIARYIVREGDAYITIVGASIGDAGIIPYQYDGANLTENAAKLCDFKKPLTSAYVAYWLRSPYLQTEISHQIKSGAQGKLALSRIKELPFPLPPLAEQHEIVRRVETLFGYADRLAARYAAAAAQVARLTPALLAKAFRGELVAQDPGDEPAGVLLARLRGATG